MHIHNDHEHHHADGSPAMPSLAGNGTAPETDHVGAVLAAKAVTMLTLCLVSMFMGIIPMKIARKFNIISTDKTVNPG